MNTTTRPNLDSLDVALAMAKRLPDYLAAGEVFRSITIDHGQHVHHVTMTLGGLLQRLHAPRARGEDDPRLEEADRLLDLSRESPAYSEQLRREFKSNLNLWRAALDDIADHRDVGWATAAGHRTRTELLRQEASALDIDISAHDDAMAGADASARLLLKAGDFTGDEGEAALYPKATFWWLWMHPKER